ncbi:hypothetical protein SNE40_020790 [Patella caerulea]|uniref:Uncharacterized protein n=1 Tax=Patella caerulea TaxID=87958 RepID=A0AAN8J5C6_PATCE
MVLVCSVCDRRKASADTHLSCVFCTKCSSEKTCELCRTWSQDQWLSVAQFGHKRPHRDDDILSISTHGCVLPVSPSPKKVKSVGMASTDPKLSKVSKSKKPVNPGKDGKSLGKGRSSQKTDVGQVSSVHVSSPGVNPGTQSSTEFQLASINQSLVSFIDVATQLMKRTCVPTAASSASQLPQSNEAMSDDESICSRRTWLPSSRTEHFADLVVDLSQQLSGPTSPRSSVGKDSEPANSDPNYSYANSVIGEIYRRIPDHCTPPPMTSSVQFRSSLDNIWHSQEPPFSRSLPQAEVVGLTLDRCNKALKQSKLKSFSVRNPMLAFKQKFYNIHDTVDNKAYSSKPPKLDEDAFLLNIKDSSFVSVKSSTLLDTSVLLRSAVSVISYQDWLVKALATNFPGVSADISSPEKSDMNLLMALSRSVEDSADLLVKASSNLDLMRRDFLLSKVRIPNNVEAVTPLLSQPLNSDALFNGAIKESADHINAARRRSYSFQAQSYNFDAGKPSQTGQRNIAGVNDRPVRDVRTFGQINTQRDRSSRCRDSNRQPFCSRRGR